MAEEEKTGKRVNFETRIEVFGEEMWTTAAIPLSLYVGRIGRRPHLGHLGLGCLFGLAVELRPLQAKSTRTGLIS